MLLQQNNTLKKVINFKTLKLNIKLPIIDKVIVNKNINIESLKSKRVISIIEDFKRITGQLPLITNFQKNISNIKQTSLGFKVTLRKNKMFIFLEKLIHFVLPRCPEFKIYSLNNFDKNGNFNLKINNYFWFTEMETVFPKITESLNINIIFNNKLKEENIFILKILGLSFK